MSEIHESSGQRCICVEAGLNIVCPIHAERGWRKSEQVPAPVGVPDTSRTTSEVSTNAKLVVPDTSRADLQKALDDCVPCWTHASPCLACIRCICKLAAAALRALPSSDSARGPDDLPRAAALMKELEAILRADQHVPEGADNCVMCHVLKAITDPIPCNHFGAPDTREARPADEALRDDDVFTLMGHAVLLRAEGQHDMPAYLMELARRIAGGIDRALEDRVRELQARATTLQSRAREDTNGSE